VSGPYLAPCASAVYVVRVEGSTVIRRILLVEDDAAMRDAIRSLLERAGFHVTMAKDGCEAWELLASGPRPAAILCDLYTPRMTGHDLVARVRRTPRLARIPIIAMSAERETRSRPSAEAFLEKPFSSEQLDWALARVGASGLL
jgi:two-component system, chemotaxis family, chemotaxis protein CheY